MPDAKNGSDTPWIGESTVSLYKRLLEHGPSTTPEAGAIAAANRLVEYVLAAIQVWEAARAPTKLAAGSSHADLGEELDALRGALTELSDGIAEMGGAATDEPDRELHKAVVDIDWANDESSLLAVLGRVRAQVVSVCSAAGSCEDLPSETRSAIDRLSVTLHSKSEGR